MGVRHSIRTNLEEVAKDLGELERTQLPFALALTLTRTAQEVRDELRSTLADHFTVRSKWVERSLQIDKADKKDADPVARVGSLYLPMALHDIGGTKAGTRGKALGVPVAARPGDEDITKPNTFPGKLKKKPNVFIAPFERNPFRVGTGPERGVFERVPMPHGAFGPVAKPSRTRHSKAAGRGRGWNANRELGERTVQPRFLKLWWTLEEDVKIRAEWPFEKTGVQVADAALIDHFWAAMEFAMRTRRIT